MENRIIISDQEKELFNELIRVKRSKLIPNPKITVNKVFTDTADEVSSLLSTGKISETILFLREKVYEEFLNFEASFNIEVIKHLSKSFPTPKEILNDIVVREKLTSQSVDNSGELIASICGEYAGRISPFIYELSLSNTQSRRSRAGKTFENIIYHLYRYFNYEFASQETLGKSHFGDKGLGKIVDSLLPNIAAFEARRDKVIVGTMKTTLRERWQEVIEELTRTQLPHIYLLTVDEDISESKAKQMGKHNVVLVVLSKVKEKKQLNCLANIISFEDYFLREIPSVLNYWHEKKI